MDNTHFAYPIRMSFSGSSSNVSLFRTVNKWPKWFGKGWPEWPSSVKPSLKSASLCRVIRCIHDRQTDRQTLCTSVTTVCISRIWCSVKITDVICRTGCSVRRLPPQPLQLPNVTESVSYINYNTKAPNSATTSDTPDCCPNTQHTYLTLTFLHSCYIKTHIRFFFHNTRIFIHLLLRTRTDLTLYFLAYLRVTVHIPFVTIAFCQLS